MARRKRASCRRRGALSLLPCVCPIQLRGTQRARRQCGGKDECMGVKNTVKSGAEGNEEMEGVLQGLSWETH